MTLVNVTVLIDEIPVIMTAIKTIVSKTVKRLKPNASHMERDILPGLCCELVDNAPLAQGVEALLSFVLDNVVLRRNSVQGQVPQWRFRSLQKGSLRCQWGRLGD